MQRDTPTLKGDLIGCAKDVEYPFCNNQSNSVSDLDVSAFTPEKRRNLSPAFQIYPKALFHPLLWKLATNFGSFSAISAYEGVFAGVPGRDSC